MIRNGAVASIAATSFWLICSSCGEAAVLRQMSTVMEESYERRRKQAQGKTPAPSGSRPTGNGRQSGSTANGWRHRVVALGWRRRPTGNGRRRGSTANSRRHRPSANGRQHKSAPRGVGRPAEYKDDRWETGEAAEYCASDAEKERAAATQVYK